MILNSLLVLLVGLFLFQLLLTIPFTRRLLVEIVSNVDLWLNFGRALPFDWEYVKKGVSSNAN